MLRSFCSVVLLLAVLSGLAGCGQKGPLYLPRDPAPAPTTTAPTAKPTAAPVDAVEPTDNASAPVEIDPAEPVDKNSADKNPVDKNRHVA